MQILGLQWLKLEIHLSYAWLKALWQEKILEKFNKLELSSQRISSSVKEYKKDWFIDVGVNLNKSEEFDINRKEKMLQEGFYSSWLQENIK